MTMITIILFAMLLQQQNNNNNNCLQCSYGWFKRWSQRFQIQLRYSYDDEIIEWIMARLTSSSSSLGLGLGRSSEWYSFNDKRPLLYFTLLIYARGPGFTHKVLDLLTNPLYQSQHRCSNFSWSAIIYVIIINHDDQRFDKIFIIIIIGIIIVIIIIIIIIIIGIIIIIIIVIIGSMETCL